MAPNEDTSDEVQDILDELVIDTALLEASNVNNQGEPGQREWLMKQHGWTEQQMTAEIEERTT